MFRYLILTTALFCATVSRAQVTVVTKATLNPEDTGIDYKQVGVRMPALTFLSYPSTAPSAMITEEKKKARKKKEEIKSQVPPMKKEDLTVLVHDHELNNGANLLVMMFNPTCSHCEDMTVMFEKNISMFQRSKLVLLATPVMKDYLPDFVNMLHVRDYPVIRAGIDSSGFISNAFNYQSLPQVNIYSAERKLLRTFNGEVSMDTLKQYIQ